MKISKALLQAIAVAVVIGTTTTSCTKDGCAEPGNDDNQQKNKVENHDCCPACGMG